MPSDFSLITSCSPYRLGERIAGEMLSGRWTDLRAAVAYVKMSGVLQVAAPLHNFVASGGTVRITVGIDQQGTSLEGLQTLWQLVDERIDAVYVLNNPYANPSPTFHPKLWLFSNGSQALLISGSGNLTGGGLFTNYEFGTVIELDLSVPKDLSVFANINEILDNWSNTDFPEVVEVTSETLRLMHTSGELPSESAISSAAKLSRAARAAMAGVKRGANVSSGLFIGRAVEKLPGASLPALPVPKVKAATTIRLPGEAYGKGHVSQDVPAIAPIHDELIIVVNPRNKTEIFLAKEPLKQDPVFFGWPFLGRTKPKRAKTPQPQPDPLPSASVTVYKSDGSVAGHADDPSLKMWTYSLGSSANDDFRITLIGGLHRMVPDGSILVMRRQPPSGFDYDISVYPPGHPEFLGLLAKCTQSLRGGRRFGWA